MTPSDVREIRGIVLTATRYLESLYRQVGVGKAGSLVDVDAELVRVTRMVAKAKRAGSWEPAHIEMRETLATELLEFVDARRKLRLLLNELAESQK